VRKGGRVRTTELNDLLTSMGTLNTMLMDLTEDDVLKLIEVERRSAKRVVVLTRLHGRFNRLRAARERRRLLAGDARWRGE
jgi:hypothetical protein